jgi:hypothetical protein
MTQIVITAVFTFAMFMFMAFPAIKIVEFIHKKKELSEKSQNILTIVFTILLSLLIALFLQS